MGAATRVNARVNATEQNLGFATVNMGRQILQRESDSDVMSNTDDGLSEFTSVDELESILRDLLRVS